MADKKISQLPKINLISGSEVILPIVHDGTTQKMDVSTFAVFTSQWSATTGSNTFIGNQTITGNTSIGGNLVVAGKLTAQELFTEITSASIIFESGSTIFGNSGDDTHQFSGSISINGKIVGNAPLDFTSQSLNTQTGSQDLVNRGISSVTGSINTTTSSFNSVFLGISSVTGAINTTTSSFDSVFLGISSFTGSLNSLTGSYATTGSNTFRGNQSITGSLSVSAGEFNVTTGSGNMTSSLIFDHTQNDGVTLGLRHNDRLSFADHTFNVQVWAAGVYTTFVRNGSPYSILNVEAFDDNKIYLYRDTRLYNKSLVIDNNLTVQKGIVIGSGSLSIERGQFSAVTGSGALTSSLSFTHTEVDPITGDGTLALRYRNNQVGSENNAWKFVATDNGVQVRYDQYTTSNKMLFSVSSFGSNFDKLLIWRDARLFGTGLTVDDSLLVKGVITGSLLSTNGVVSSSNQLFELNAFTASVIGQTNTIAAFTSSVNFTTQSLNTQTGSQNSLNTSLGLITSSIYGEITSFNSVFQRVSSTTGSINTTTSSFDSVFLRISSTTGSMNTQSSSQDLVNLGISSVTGSLIGITNGLMAFTAALDSTYATDAQLYQLYQATSSIHSTTQSLNVQTGSQDLVNRGISSVTGSINTTTSSFNSVFSQIGSTTSSLIGITNGLMAFTAALDSTYATDAQLYQLYEATSSIHFTTQSLNIQTGSQDLVNLGISTFTGSLRSEVNLIEAYTASLKGAAIVSSSQQIKDYYTFAQTSSANIFYGNQAVSGSIIATSFVLGAVNSTILGTNGALRASNVARTKNVNIGYDDTSNYGFIISVEPGVDYKPLIMQGVASIAAPVIIGDTTNDGINKLQVTGAAKFTSAVTASNFKVSTAGGGIDFSATSDGSGTTSSELLNDYEEGTWTPTVVFVGTPGTVNYTNRTGRYTKIGRIVHLEYSLTACSITGSVGYITITGLPFTINSSTAGYQSFAPYGATTFPSSSVLYQQGGTGDTKIYPQSITNSGFYGDMTNTNINSGGTFSVAATYTYST